MDRSQKNTPGARNRARTRPEALAAFRKRLRDDAKATAALGRLVELGVPRKALVGMLFTAGMILYRRAALQANQLSFREAVGLPNSLAAKRLIKKLRSLAKEMEPVDVATRPHSDEEIERVADTGAGNLEGLIWLGSDEEFQTDLSVPASSFLRAKAAHLGSLIYTYQKRPRYAISGFVEEQVVLFVRSHAKARRARGHFQATCDLLDWLYRLPKVGNYEVQREAVSRRVRRIERLRKSSSAIR